MCWQKLPGVRGKIVSALARLDRLRAGVGTPCDAEELKWQTILFEYVPSVHHEQMSTLIILQDS